MRDEGTSESSSDEEPEEEEKLAVEFDREGQIAELPKACSDLRSVMHLVFSLVQFSINQREKSPKVRLLKPLLSFNIDKKPERDTHGHGHGHGHGGAKSDSDSDSEEEKGKDMHENEPRKDLFLLFNKFRKALLGTYFEGIEARDLWLSNQDLFDYRLKALENLRNLNSYLDSKVLQKFDNTNTLQLGRTSSTSSNGS